MKILALVASQDSTVEDVKTNGRRQMQALIGKDKEVLFCEYSTIEICRNGELVITCLGEKMEKPDYFWPLLGSTDGFILENMRLSAEQIEALQQEWVTANEHKDEAEQLTLDL